MGCRWLFDLELFFELISPVFHLRELGVAVLDDAFQQLDFLVLAAAADDRDGVVVGNDLHAVPGGVEAGLGGGDGGVQAADLLFNGGAVGG